ncbi:MAG: hypothetical protein PWQ18_252 [Clostridia bacterium]|nr:hypothetical protein [Clostridia bacterium]
MPMPRAMALRACGFRPVGQRSRLHRRPLSRARRESSSTSSCQHRFRPPGRGCCPGGRADLRPRLHTAIPGSIALKRPVEEALIQEGDFSVKPGAVYPPPTAVFAFNDKMVVLIPTQKNSTRPVKQKAARGRLFHRVILSASNYFLGVTFPLASRSTFIAVMGM